MAIADIDAAPSLSASAQFAATHASRGSLVPRTLALADVIGLLGAFLCTGHIISSDRTFTHLVPFVFFLLFLPAWIVGASLSGLYSRDDERLGHSTVDDVGRVFQLLSVMCWLFVASLWLFTSSTPRSAAVTFWALAFAGILGMRVLARYVVRRHPNYRQRTVIVGAGEIGQLVGRKLMQHPEFGVRLVGFVDSMPKSMRGDLDHVPLLGAPENIVDIVRSNDIRRVVVAFSNDRHDLLVSLVRKLRNLDVQIDLVPRLFETVGPVAGVHIVEGLPLVGLPPTKASRLAQKAKRLLDLVIALILLLVLAPLLAVIALLVKRDSPGPIMFRQVRLGEGQKPFEVFKFRTMLTDTDDRPHREYLREIMHSSALPAGNNNLYKLERRNVVTKTGAWLRKTSLDELPQLFNVLLGQMSLVGPRPCIPYEIELYEEHHFDRFRVPAGMTGLWQVSARAHSTFKEALDLDTTYARNWSLGLDLWLLARTPAVLFRGKETT
jgi:exopolysaccharide biosynthesis polyprenyl glycosylphosphotransferase